MPLICQPATIQCNTNTFILQYKYFYASIQISMKVNRNTFYEYYCFNHNTPTKYHKTSSLGSPVLVEVFCSAKGRRTGIDFRAGKSPQKSAFWHFAANFERNFSRNYLFLGVGGESTRALLLIASLSLISMPCLWGLMPPVTFNSFSSLQQCF